MGGSTEGAEMYRPSRTQRTGKVGGSTEGSEMYRPSRTQRTGRWVVQLKVQKCIDLLERIVQVGGWFN